MTHQFCKPNCYTAGVKPGLLPVALLGLVAVGGAVAMQTAGRERNYRSLLGRGDVALRDGDTFGAIEAFSGAVALHPDSMLAHLRRGESYRQRGELEAAARDFRTAAALDAAAPHPLEALADVYYERRRYDRAIDTYERRLRLDERAPRIRYKLALAHYRAGHMGEAMTALTDTLALDPRLPDAHYLLGLCLRDQDRPREAVDAFERAVTLAPGLIPAREELAALYEQLGRYPSQLEQLQVLAALDSTHVQRQIAVGLAHARAGHPDAAAVTLANALERSPDDPLVYQEIGRMWLEIAATNPEADALKKALDAFSHLGAGPTASSEMLTLYGRALALNGELDAAQRLLEQATKRYPVAPESFVALADVAEQQHQADTARAALLDYHALAGDDALASPRAGRIGLLSLTLNDLPAATRWLRRALSAEPDNARWLKGLADAEFQSGDLASAQLTLTRAIDADPGNKDLVLLARRLTRAAQQAQQAQSLVSAAAPASSAAGTTTVGTPITLSSPITGATGVLSILTGSPLSIGGPNPPPTTATAATAASPAAASVPTAGNAGGAATTGTTSGSTTSGATTNTGPTATTPSPSTSGTASGFTGSSVPSGSASGATSAPASGSAATPSAASDSPR